MTTTSTTWITGFSHPQQKLLKVAFIISAIVLALHSAAILLVPSEFPNKNDIHDVLMAIEGCICAVALLTVARRARHRSRRLGQVWTLIGLATAAYACGDVIWAILEVGFKQDPFPSLADIGYLLYYPLFAVGLLLFPHAPRERSERWKLSLDISIVAVAALLFYGTVLFRPMLQVNNDEVVDWLTQFVTFAYPSLDLMLLLVVMVLVSRQNDRAERRPLLLLGLSAVLLAVADTAFNYADLNDLYVDASSWIDVCYIAMYITAFWAGLWHAEHSTNPIGEVLDAHKFEQGKKHGLWWAHVLLPYLTIAITYVLLVREHQISLSMESGESLFWMMAGGTALVIGLALVRQLVVIFENTALSAQLSKVLDASRILTTPLALDTLPQLVANELREVMEFDQASLLLLGENNTALLTPLGTPLAEHGGPFSIATSVALTEWLHRQQTILIIDTEDTDNLENSINDVKTLQQQLLPSPSTLSISSAPDNSGVPIGSWLAAPLVINERVIGALAVGRRNKHFYSYPHARIMTIFAHQTAAAMENARLRQHQARAAVIAERGRLARDLHDSVSQAIFGITLGAHTALELADKQHGHLKNSLNYVLALADGALTEMRALIFELRPESLEHEGLVRALEQQVNSLCKRHSIQANIHAPNGEPPINIDRKEALYRITIEAMQNIIKHAQANTVTVSLSQYNTTVELDVQDNGRGFDAKQDFPGHFGLTSMRERAAQVDAEISIDSLPGNGTHIRVTMPMYGRQLN